MVDFNLSSKVLYNGTMYTKYQQKIRDACKILAW